MHKKLVFLVFFGGPLIGLAQKNTRPVQVPAGESKGFMLQDSLMMKDWFFSGLREKTIQNYQLAAEFFKRITDMDAKNDAAQYELANIYHSQNRDQEAEALIRKATALKPANEWYWLLLADIYKRGNKLADLNGVFDELIKISPDKEDYYYDKANALLLQGKPDDAMVVYTVIEKRFGASDDLVTSRQRVYQKQGKTGQAATELEKLVTDNPAEVRNYLELGQLYINSGNKEKAMQVLLKAKTLDAANPYISLSLADLYRAQGKTDDAFVELKSAFASPEMNIDSKIRIILSFFPQLGDAKMRAQADELGAILVKANPGDPKSFSVYGDLLFQEQKFTEARQSYKKALALNNQVYQIWEQLIRIELDQADPDAAIADGEEALSIFPNQAALYLLTGIASAQKKNHEKAVSYLKNAASLETEDKAMIAQVYALLGDSYNALKKFSESDQSYEKSLLADPVNTYTLNNYAYYLSLRGVNLEKAEALSRKSNELSKNNASFEDTYAWVLFRQKKYKEAKMWIEKSMNSEKGASATQTEHYGDILFQLGEKELALKQWLLAKERGAKSEKLEQKINEKRYID
ncbi:tetratricopeptide repeat protein [Hufsiella ginkgonis]|uniref:Tetratricopeptide repeat protein n=1 Tax=Hufsiella ginkgonis TaxID=2695274 RepID=A0A7K1Y4F0_9SPHI|nr:tetratricopeptide repeat protein [Hufsiella ginkgonis]MXV17939.1 tetratricopeptide repeat protein [Hufsiella ginkgonis]